MNRHGRGASVPLMRPPTTKAQKKREKFARQFHSAEFVEWTQQSRCVVCGSVPSKCAHNPSRGAGGTWDDVSPLCVYCHEEQHHGVETFQRKHGIRFSETNAAHAANWRQRDGDLD